MTRPVPEDGREIEWPEWDRPASPMRGYLQVAAEDVAAHGELITDTRAAVLAAAHMKGRAIIHAAIQAAHVIVDGLGPGLAKLASAQQNNADASERQVTAMRQVAEVVDNVAGAIEDVAVRIGEVGGSIGLHGDDVSAALERIADALSDLVPGNAPGVDPAAAPGASE